VTQQLIITTPANSGQGDSPKSAFDKVNANFTDLYSGAVATFGGVSVISFGADSTGASDSTAAFAAAAAAAPTGVNSQGAVGGSGITFAPNATVYVPPGTYTLSSTVNTNGTDITWVLSDDALIANYQYLNGRVLRNGRRVNKATYGIGDFAAGFSIGANEALEQGAPVMGFTSAQQRQTLNYTSFDTVGLTVYNSAPAPIQNIADAGTTYTATTISFTTPLSTSQLAQMRSGMFVGTRHSPSWYGYVTAWTSNTVTVSGWYQMTGSGTGTPPNGTGAYINPSTKSFGANILTLLGASSIATASAACEFDTINNLANPGGFGGSPLCWGVDSVNIGTYPAEAAFIARGSWYFGYQIGPGVNNANTTVYGFVNNATYGTSVTSNCVGFISAPSLSPSLATGAVHHYQASNVALGAGATAGAQVGFFAAPLSGATNNYDFYSSSTKAANQYSFYGAGGAAAYFGGFVQVEGSLQIDGASALTTGANVTGTFNGATTVYAYQNTTTFGTGVTSNCIGFISAPALSASLATGNVRHYQASNVALGGGATAATQVGFFAAPLSGATNNYGFYSAVAASGLTQWAFYGSSTAPSLLGGPLYLTGAAASSAQGGLQLGGTTQTTVGANGAASAQPANPLGYLICYIGSTKIAIPYHNG
jgi:hypothetical protein